MKTTIIIIALIAGMGVSTAYGAVALLKSTKIADVGIGTNTVEVRKVVDGDTTCYITMVGKFGSHAISCVR